MKQGFFRFGAGKILALILVMALPTAFGAEQIVSQSVPTVNAVVGDGKRS